MQQSMLSGSFNGRATLSGSHNSREFTLEVSHEVWDRFRDWKNRFGKDTTTGAFLAEIADSRPDPTVALSESDVRWYLDALESFVSGMGEGQGAPKAADTA